MVGFSFAKLYFVIKEAVFKAYYAIAKTFLDFQDVEVNIDCYLKEFSARLEDDLRGFFRKHVLDGKFENSGGPCFAVVVLPKRDTSS